MPFNEVHDCGRRAGPRLLAALLAGTALTLASQARAQEAAPASKAPPAAEAGDSTTTDVVIVTARKRTETAQTVPVALQAVTGVQLAQANVTQLVSLTTLTPNFTVSYGTSQPTTIMRGLGSGSNLSFDQAVGKFIDNISYGRDQDARLPLFDLQRVEVLRGPQVLIFGNSSTAGALNIVTVRPGKTFEADASVAYENRADEFNAQGGVTAPLADWASLRLAGLFQDRTKGWVRNLSDGSTGPRSYNRAGRATLRLVPTDRLEVLLKAEIDRVQDRGSALQAYKQTIAPPNVFTEVALDSVRNVSNAAAPFQRDEFTYVRNETYQSDINYQVLGGTLTSTTAYRRERIAYSLDGDLSPLPIFHVDVNQRYQQFSQELRFSGTGGPFEYTAGGYYQHDQIHVFGFQDFNLAAVGRPLPAFARLSLFDEKTNTLSAFADLTYHLTEQLSFEAGVRYVNTRRTADQAALAANVVPGPFMNFGEAQSLAAINPALNAGLRALGVTPHSFTGLSVREDHWQPQLVAQYSLSAQTMFYAKYVKGAKAGGVDYIYGGGDPNAAKFLPEKATSYEVGVKGSLPGSMDYTFDLYTTLFRDLQVSSFNGVSSFIVTNAGEARSRGAELSVNWRPVTGLRLSFTGGYLDAEYLRFTGASCTFAQTAATPAGAVCRQDLSGTPTQFASKWSGTLAANYEHSLGESYRLSEGVTVPFRTKYNAGSQNNPLEVQSGFAQVDAYVNLKPEQGWWVVTLFGRNLTNEQYMEIATGGAPAFGGETAGISRGRQIGLRLDAKF